MTPMLSDHERFETLTIEAMRQSGVRYFGTRDVRASRNEAAGTPRRPRKPAYRGMGDWRETGVLVR